MGDLFVDTLGQTVIRIVFGANPPDTFNLCREFPTLTPSVTCPFPGWTAEVSSRNWMQKGRRCLNDSCLSAKRAPVTDRSNARGLPQVEDRAGRAERRRESS